MKKKKILIISPNSMPDKADESYMCPPLGVVRLAAFLKKRGHDAEYYDINFNTYFGKGINFEEKLKEKEWDIIGFSTLMVTLIQDIENMYKAQKLCPNALLIAGGLEAQFNYQTILDKTPCKIVVIGEGEIPLLNIANEAPLDKIPGIVFKNYAVPMSTELFWEATQAIDWETIPYEEYWDSYANKYGEKFDKTKEYEIKAIRVFSRNRCPFECNFCSSTHQLTKASGKKAVPVLGITEGQLLEIIDRIVNAHPDVKTIYFTDDDFCVNPQKTISFCKEVAKRDYNVEFLCFSRISDINEELLEWLKKAKFRQLNIGVESFSMNALQDINKKYTPEIIHKNLSLLKRYQMPTYFCIIPITPNSTLQDVEITVDNTIHYLADGFFKAGMTMAITPLKGTYFYEAYSDYLTKIEDIPNTDFKIKRELMIYVKDPIVRELQIRFYNEIDGVIDEKVKEHSIVHKVSINLVRIKLDYMKKLINEIKQKYNITN